jgi:GNAT superfamily N-acetyltransferase
MQIRNPKKSEMKELKKLMLKYGDVPSEEAVAATKESKRKQWLVVISKGRILGAGRTFKTDWYEWTLKNAFVVPASRGLGIASILYEKLTDKAKAEGAKVCEADITATNIPSKIAATRAGMLPVNSFKWDKDETHADIYQEVFTPPTRNEVLKINTHIDSQFMLRKKKTPVGIHSPFSVTKKKRRMLK